jgi:hypothetical protein
VVVDRELARERREHRQHLGRERAHDLPHLVGLRLAAAVVGAPLVDVVLQESAHGGGQVRGWGVERRLEIGDAVMRVRGRVDRAEQLGVDERVLLARVGIGAAHHLVGRPAVGVRRDLEAVDRPIRQILARDPVEVLTGRHRHRAVGVEVAQQVVERPVLEHDDHEVVEPGAVGAVRDARHGRAQRCGRGMPCGRHPARPGRRADPETGRADPGRAQEPAARGALVAGRVVHVPTLAARMRCAIGGARRRMRG